MFSNPMFFPLLGQTQDRFDIPVRPRTSLPSWTLSVQVSVWITQNTQSVQQLKIKTHDRLNRNDMTNETNPLKTMRVTVRNHPH